MKIILALATGLLLWCSASLADDQAAVRDFVARYDRAYLARDIPAVDALLAADYRVVAEGEVADRATSLAKLAGPPEDGPPDALVSTIERTHVAGDLAVAVGHIDWKDGDKSGSEHFTLVLRREAGQWRAVEEHISEASQAKAD